ncbi:MAG: arginine--tRNA ligase [Candidatus Paceibacterota bacterium]
MQEKLKILIGEALKKLGIDADVSNIVTEHPEDISNGDYSTNVALVYSKQLKTSPKDLAEKVVAEISKNKIPEIEKVEVAGPGFINFYLSHEFFANSIKQIVEEGENFGKNDSLKNKKVIIEYTDPNPFKEFHIGHLMSNSIGESIARLVEFSGAEVKRACYQGDVGLHVAKAMSGILMNESLLPNEKDSVISKAEFLGMCYKTGSMMYESDDEHKQEIAELNKKIYERSDKKINALYDLGKKWSLEYFEGIYKKLGTTFDYYFFESNTADLGKKIVEENIGKIFEKSDGAVIFKGEKYDLHTRVFINKEGIATYEAKELGLAKIKHDEYSYDKSIIITGNEVRDYFSVVLKAMELLFPELRAKTKHLSHGMLRLPTGKMSSRTGDVITAESLMSDISKLIEEKIKDRGFDDDEKKEIAERVSIGAIKYSILKQSAGSDIIYDFEKSISFEGDSGPYIQYSFVRAKSVLEKLNNSGLVETIEKELSDDIDEGSSELEKMLYRFPEIVVRSQNEYSLHYIAIYLTEIASLFNSFYANNKILDPDDLKTSAHRLALTKAVYITLKNGLHLLGIKVPEKM